MAEPPWNGGKQGLGRRVAQAPGLHRIRGAAALRDGCAADELAAGIRWSETLRGAEVLYSADWNGLQEGRGIAVRWRVGEVAVVRWLEAGDGEDGEWMGGCGAGDSGASQCRVLRRFLLDWMDGGLLPFSASYGNVAKMCPRISTR